MVRSKTWCTLNRKPFCIKYDLQMRMYVRNLRKKFFFSWDEEKHDTFLKQRGRGHLKVGEFLRKLILLKMVSLQT